MNRRNFILRNTLAGLGTASLSMIPFIPSEAAPLNQRAIRISNLAGLSLRDLYQRYEKELFDRFLPAMDELCVDGEYGGFICDADISTRKRLTDSKRTWFQGRGIWVYSFLYTNFRKDPKYLDIARKAIDLVSKFERTPDKFLNTSYTRDGKILSGPGDIYGDLFVAEGLAEYGRATGDRSYIGKAKDMIFYCLERYDRPDYVYDISYAPGRPKIEGPRNLGHWMIFLSLSTQMLAYEQDEDFQKLADRCIDAIMNRHINPEFNLLVEMLNHDFSIPKNEYATFGVIGHGIETLAFVMAEAARRKDADLFDKADAAFRRHVEVAADKLYGGHFEILNNANTYAWAQSKSAWCQQEVSIGAMLSIEHTGQTWATECFNDNDAYMMAKMRTPHLAFWTFGGGRKMDVPNLKTIEHYHMPRYLMRNMMALQRMMDRKGRVSGLLHA